MVEAPLFRRILGDDFDRMPAPIREMHDLRHDSVAVGVSEIARGQSVVARLIGMVTGLPPAGAEVPVSVTFALRDGTEVWRRDFDGRGFRTRLGAAAARPGHVVERYGPTAFLLELRADGAGLDLLVRRMTAFGLPVPRALWPRVVASERVVDGQFAFDVTMNLPFGGLLVRYRGRLQPPRPLPQADVLN